MNLGVAIMRTLYVRIIATTMGIMIASALIAFVVTNIYYQYYLKPENDKKVTQIAENIVTVFEKNDYTDISPYLQSMTDLRSEEHTSELQSRVPLVSCVVLDK